LNKELIENQAEGTSLIKEEVTREDIAEVVAKWTGIPIMKMLQENEKTVASGRRIDA
jgi:ATP-dependent Clp protease ATP-binding subunit ClpB